MSEEFRYSFYDKCLCLSLDQGTVFIKYDNIYSIGRPIKKDGKWSVEIRYATTCSDTIGYFFPFGNIEEAEVRYKELVEKCTEYHTKKQFYKRETRQTSCTHRNLARR